jgi:hypothetical protein
MVAAAATLDPVVMEVDNSKRCQRLPGKNSKIPKLTHNTNKEKACFWEQVDNWRYLR